MANTNTNSKVVKVTKRDNLNEIIKIVGELGRQDLVEFAEHEIAILDKKNANRKTEDLTEDLLLIAEYLTNNPEGATCGQLIKGIPSFADYSTSKCSARTSRLVNAGTIVRVTEKGKSIFRLA